jgi:hypothetical protein
MRKLIDIFTHMSVECRHGTYVWWLTGACLTGIMLLAMTRTGTVVEHAVDALSSVLITVVCTYLGVELAGRSQLLTKIGERISPSTSGMDAAETAAQPQK